MRFGTREPKTAGAVAETVNFRLFHRHPRALAEAVLQKAERTRGVQQRKWFGRVGDDWDPKCRIYLYASGEDYGEATGARSIPEADIPMFKRKTAECSVAAFICMARAVSCSRAWCRTR